MSPLVVLVLSTLGLIAVLGLAMVLIEVAHRAELNRRAQRLQTELTEALRAKRVNRQKVLGDFCGFCGHDLTEHDTGKGSCRRTVSLDPKFSPVECFCHQWMPAPPEMVG